jgi:acyl-CoA thioester hydrolase
MDPCGRARPRRLTGAPTMPRVLVQTFVVPAEAIDVNGHVNSLAYLRWMQEVAIQHSTEQGWPVERYQAAGTGWVVRSHFIEYLLPAFAGESLTLLTWVTGFNRHSSPRRYLFWRARDRQVLARAETVWIFVNGRNGRPERVPDEVQQAFEVVAEDEEVLALLVTPGATE